MIFEIRFTPKAEETFVAIKDQLQQRWGNKFVAAFEKKTLKNISAISRAPFIHPICDEITQTRKCVLHRNCSMLYKIFESEVVVILFWDNRQEPLF